MTWVTAVPQTNVVLYNTTTTTWPGRPALAICPAGYALYISAVSSAANPVDMQIGDVLFIPTTSAAPSFTAASPPNGTISTAYNYTFVANNNPTSYAVASGTVPAGLTFNTSTGVLSGTPTTAAAYTFTISATNNSGTTNATQSSVTIAASGSTLSPLNNTPGNWTGVNDGNGVSQTIAADSTNQHNAAATLQVTEATMSPTQQTYGGIYHVITGLVAGNSYSMPTMYAACIAGTVNRKAYVHLIWQSSGGATNTGEAFGGVLNLTSGFQTMPAITNIVAPASSVQIVVELVYQSTDGSTPAVGEHMNWSFT